MMVLREMRNNIEIIHIVECRIQIEDEKENIKKFFEVIRGLK
jgi:hypothetical protein